MNHLWKWNLFIVIDHEETHLFLEKDFQILIPYTKNIGPKWVKFKWINVKILKAFSKLQILKPFKSNFKFESHFLIFKCQRQTQIIYTNFLGFFLGYKNLIDNYKNETIFVL